MSESTLPPSAMPRRPRQIGAHVAAALLALACALSCALWGLRIWKQMHRTPPAVPTLSAPQAVAADAARLFGAAAARQVAARQRLHLQGVIGGGPHAGAALIGMDGKPAQAYAVGAAIAPGLRLVDTGFGQAVVEHDGVREVLHTPSAPPATRPAGIGAAGAARAAAASGQDLQAMRPPGLPDESAALAQRRYRGP